MLKNSAFILSYFGLSSDGPPSPPEAGLPRQKQRARHRRRQPTSPAPRAAPHARRAASRSVGCVLARTPLDRRPRVGASIHSTCVPTKAVTSFPLHPYPTTSNVAGARRPARTAGAEDGGSILPLQAECVIIRPPDSTTGQPNPCRECEFLPKWTPPAKRWSRSAGLRVPKCAESQGSCQTSIHRDRLGGG